MLGVNKHRNYNWFLKNLLHSATYAAIVVFSATSPCLRLSAIFVNENVIVRLGCSDYNECTKEISRLNMVMCCVQCLLCVCVNLHGSFLYVKSAIMELLLQCL